MQDNPFAFNPDADTTPSTPTQGSLNLFAFVAPTGWMKFVSVMLGLFCLISVLAIVSSFMQLNLLTEAQNGAGPNFQQRAEENDNREMLIAMLTLLCLLVAAVASLRLLHRLRSNVDHLGAVGLTNTPGWSIGWFFVPIAHLVRPYGATCETWQASANPEDWSSEPRSSMLGVWWFFWIVGSIVGQISSRMGNSANPTIDSLITATWVDAGHSVLSLMAALSFLAVLFGITKAQMATYHRLSADASTGF